ncbi:alpha-tocopherol transfer protein-like isoform X1 [Macrosteles quadrilineatus]|uniref:alpha-tocopherol transfer protein-like isoform X1 n=1 Tax=Macrosteles quadrilineatus TaxID=74068 RepID=UPI0023E14E1A|nr:alpha-tocopherol transfer protein-like isoform X1 [Macrosteles quadrilineatus]
MPEYVAVAAPGVTLPVLPGEWAQRAFVELNEIPEAAVEALHELKLRIADDTELHACTDDAFLLRFLRARKFNISKAFTMLQRYYRMKEESPELFRIPRPSERLHILEMNAQCVLDDRDHNGSRVYIFRVGQFKKFTTLAAAKKAQPLTYQQPPTETYDEAKVDTSLVTVEDVFSTNVLALEHVVREPETQVGGITVIVDMTGFGLQQHAKFLSPYYARRTVEVIQETFPLRFKGFHVINQPFYFDAVFAVLRPFLKEKIRQRIYLHGKDLSSLHSYVDQAILPVEYGGLQSEFDNTRWRQQLLELEQEFMELETFGYKHQDEINDKEEIDLL